MMTMLPPLLEALYCFQPSKKTATGYFWNTTRSQAHFPKIEHTALRPVGFYLGHGIIGGMLTSGKAQARTPEK
jgi:hypothetical protein